MVGDILKLLIREEKIFDELFLDYMSRLAYRNGFDSLDSFTRRVKPGRQILDYLRFQNGIELLLSRKIDATLDYSFLKSRHNFTNVGICDLCFSENAYIRWYWRLARFSVCAKHRVGLRRFETSFDCFFNRNETGVNRMSKNIEDEIDIQLFHLKVHSIKCSIKTILIYDFCKIFIDAISEFYRAHFKALNTNNIFGKMRDGRLFETSIENTLNKILHHLIEDTQYDYEHVKVVAIFLFFQIKNVASYSRYNIDATAWVIGIFNCPRFSNLRGLKIIKAPRFTDIFQGYDEISSEGDRLLTVLMKEIAKLFDTGRWVSDYKCHTFLV